MRCRAIMLATTMTLTGLALGCGDDADEIGVAAECASTADCPEEEALECLTDFKGGYCGLSGCMANADCPDNSICVTYDNGTNYCFRICSAKADCNANRSEANEANCVSSVDRVEGGLQKVCEPPSA